VKDLWVAPQLSEDQGNTGLLADDDGSSSDSEYYEVDGGDNYEDDEYSDSEYVVF